MSSSPVPLKTRPVGQRCTLNMSRAQTSSRWCGVVVRKGGTSSGVILVTWPWFKLMRPVAKSPRVAEQCDVYNHSLESKPPFFSMLILMKIRCYLESKAEKFVGWCKLTMILNVGFMHEF
ncbi:uncharacterized protein TNCV_1652011 [Trichonephila clavipes]|nr:uncharacterized protein TNCV_1652011 [Trichonephila clavipes]